MAHPEPVWRDRADFILGAQSPDDPSLYEQLWARRIDEVRFEICCIPFLIYDLALGDEVEADARTLNLTRVVRASGGYTFRAWFEDPTNRGSADAITANIADIGCLFEWNASGNLLAIHASDKELASTVSGYLLDLERNGALTYETGRTQD
jgi:hypothetical protein